MYSSVHFGIKGISYLFTRNNRLFLQMQKYFALLSLEVDLFKAGMVKTFPSASRCGRASLARFWHWIAETKNAACVSSSTFPALLGPIQVPRTVSYLCGPGNPAEPPTGTTWGRCVCLQQSLIWGLGWQDLRVSTLPLTGLVKFPKCSLTNPCHCHRDNSLWQSSWEQQNTVYFNCQGPQADAFIFRDSLHTHCQKQWNENHC